MRALAAFLLLPSFALAANYEVPLTDVDEEDDIIALEQKGDISTETADILIDLIRDGVDLNTGSRDDLYDLPGLNYTDVDAIILYRTNKGRIDDPTELVGAGAITAEQLLLITPFIRLEPVAFRFPISGRFRLFAASSSGDFQTQGGATPPPGLLAGKLKLPLGFSAGFLIDTTNRQVGNPYYDNLRQQLVVDPLGYRFGIPGLWAQWKSGQAKVVIGTFTIGFAERLTIDNTHRLTPEGIYENEFYRRPIYEVHGGNRTDEDPYVTPDFQLRPNFRGAAGSIEDLEFGSGQKLSLFGFLSYQTRGIYQYEIYDKNGGANGGIPCEDPRDDANPSCKAPPVAIVRNNQPDQPLQYSTLPNLYEELVGGARVEFKPNDRYRFGLTGYGATNFFHGAPLQLDTQEWSTVPSGGPYGAIGLDGRAQFGKFGLFIEAARSFDSIKAAPTYLGIDAPAGGGGFAVEQRTVYSPKGHEVELSLRYYDDKFGNPFARPYSAPDELDGQRARNEAGIRLKYAGKLPADFDVHARADFWVLPFDIPGGERAGTANLYALARVDYVGFRKVRPAIWVDIKNRDLKDSQHGKCAGTVVTVEGSMTADCVIEPTIEGVTAASTGTGDSYRIASRVDFHILGRYLGTSVQGALTWADDVRYKDRFRQDVMFWGEIRTQPWDFLQVRLRSKFLWQDISTNDYLEQSLWTFLEGTYILNRNFRFSLRYDVYAYLDKRDSTLKHFPNPEHRFFLDLAAGF